MSRKTKGRQTGAQAGAALGATIGLLGGPIGALAGSAIGYSIGGLFQSGKQDSGSRSNTLFNGEKEEFKVKPEENKLQLYGQWDEGEAKAFAAQLGYDPNRVVFHKGKTDSYVTIAGGGGEEEAGAGEGGSSENDALLKEYAAYTKGIADEELAKSRELWNMWKSTYQPGEISWAKQTFAGIPADQEVAWATQDVNASFDRNEAIANRELQRLGINPASPAYAHFTKNYAQARAAAEAGARNTARRNVRDTNWERRMQAIQIGSRLPTQSSGMAANAANIAGEGVGRVSQNNQFQTDLSARLAEAAANREFQAEQNAINREWQSEQNAQARKDQQDANMWNAIGSLGGTAGQAIGAYIGSN